MSLPLANVQATDTFQTWLDRTNEIIVNAANNNIVAVQSYADFTANTASVPYQQGRLFYDSNEGALNFYNEESEITLQIGQEEYLRVKNNTLSTINNGAPVYIAGSDGVVPTVEPAAANSAATLYAVGLATHAIEANSIGYVTTHGIVKDIDTSSISPGGTVYLAPAGGFQSASATYPNYPHEIGYCIKQDATQGCIFVVPQQHTFEDFRVTDNVRVDGSMTIAGNFEVLGTEVITTITNLDVADSFVYLNTGDTVTANASAVSGLNDLTFKGHYNGGNNVTYYVKIDSTDEVGSSDTFSWSIDNFSTTEAANVAIDGTEQLLRWGIKAQFVANTGHTVDDVWTGAAAPTNIDVGIVGNRNTGNTGIGYTHIGVFFDVTDEKFKFFDAYRPEVEGDVNVSDPTFSLGTVVGTAFEGSGASLTALNATQLTSGTVPEARLTQATTSTKGIASFSSDNFAVAGGIVTIKDNGVILGTETAGNYVATVADAGSGRITVTGSGSESAAVTLDIANQAIAAAQIADGTITSTKIAALGITANVIANDSVALGTKTTGNYVATVANTDSNITVSGSGSETAAVSIGLADSLNLSGTVTATDFNSTSDITLKENIVRISDPLDKVMQLAGVNFDWKESGEHAMGVIAQEVEKVVPEVVSTNENGIKTVKYSNMIGLMIEAIKELKEIVDKK
jgi:hypothetical protein